VSVIKFEDIESKIIELRNEKVLLDSDVAELYGVETKRINEAVKNNPNRFPCTYVYELSKDELEHLRSKFSSTKFTMTRAMPKAFTEKGLYMLATILSSEKAIQTTLAIIETFTKIRHLSHSIKELATVQDKVKQKSLMQKSGEIIADIIDSDFEATDTETSIEINFAVLKFKHLIKKKKQ